MPVFVNKLEISDDEVNSEMQHHPAPSVEEARGEASRALIIKRLLLEAAVDQKMIKFDELESLGEDKEELIIEALLSSVITVPKADEETCQRYYDQNSARFIDKNSGEPLPFKMVRDHIKIYLEDKGHMSAFNAYVDSLMDKAQIVGLK